MPLNNYLVIGVNPANNETTVPTDKAVVITFSKHMDVASLTTSNLVLKEVNGDIVPYTMTYSANIMTATLTPSVNYNPGTQYQLKIVGTADGIKSITGDYMGVSRSYEFTTSFTSSLSYPTNLSASVDSGFVTLTWQRPADYDIGSVLSYEVNISSSNDPLSAPMWPSTGDINQTHATVLNVPKKFSEGNYYAHIRALHGDDTSEWTSIQFLVEAPATVPAPTLPPDNGGDIFSFDVLDTYPRKDSVDVTPQQVMIVFGADVDPATATEDSIYIIKKEDKDELSLIDFLTDYSPAKKVEATLEPIVTPNIVVLSATLEDDAEYTVIVRETVANSTGGALGIAYHWSFLTKYTQLYGDPALVRQDLGGLSDSVSDKQLYQFLSESTKYAYQIASLSAAFDSTLYANGAAPYYMHQYVRFRTVYNLIINSQLNAGGAAGFTTDVTLGDLTVSKEASGGASLSDVLAELKVGMKQFMDMIQGHNNRGYAKPIVVIRGENAEAYPDFLSGTRSEFPELGQ